MIASPNLAESLGNRADSPIFVATDLGHYVDEFGSSRSGQGIRFPDGTDGHPRTVLGTQIAENHIFCWYLLQWLADHRQSITRRYKRKRAGGSVGSLTIRGLKSTRRQTF
jgi:hypothetical protein